MAGRAGAVEAVLGLVAQPGVAGAVVAAGRVAAALQHHGAVLPAPARRAQAEVRRAPVYALAVRARRVPAVRRSLFPLTVFTLLLLSNAE